MNALPPITVLSALLLLLGGCRRNAPGNTPDSLAGGWRQYSYGAYDDALGTFDRIARRTPAASDEHLQAIYGMATVWDLRRPGEDPARAEKLYREVRTLKPPSEIAAWSLLALARMQALVPVDQQPARAAVRAAYQKVIDAYPDRVAGEEAFILQQTDAVQTFDKEEARRALAALAKFAAERPHSFFLDAAHSLMASCHRVLDEPEQRLAEEIRALEIREARARAEWEKHPEGRFVFNDPAVFEIAHIAEFEAGDFGTARKFYRRYLQENPTDKRTFFACQALERMDRTETELRGQPTPAGPPTQS